jgi:hypothetical protein
MGLTVRSNTALNVSTTGDGSGKPVQKERRRARALPNAGQAKKKPLQRAERTSMDGFTDAARCNELFGPNAINFGGSW